MNQNQRRKNWSAIRNVKSLERGTSRKGVSSASHRPDTTPMATVDVVDGPEAFVKSSSCSGQERPRGISLGHLSCLEWPRELERRVIVAYPVFNAGHVDRSVRYMNSTSSTNV